MIVTVVRTVEEAEAEEEGMTTKERTRCLFFVADKHRL